MYRNVVYESSKEQMRLFTWDEDGKRIVVTQSYNPYLYIEPKDNRHKTAESIYKSPLRKLVFKRDAERRQFIRQNKIKRLFENLPAKQQFLLDNFWQVNETEDFTKNDIKMLLLDIETYSPDSFPSVENANHPINVITVYDNLEKKFYSWGTKEYTGKGRPDLVYKYCVSERQLFKDFLDYLEKDYPEIVDAYAKDPMAIVNKAYKYRDIAQADVSAIQKQMFDIANDIEKEKKQHKTITYNIVYYLSIKN